MRAKIIPKEEMTPYQRWELASFNEPEPEPPPPEPVEEDDLEEPPPPPQLTAEQLDAIREAARQEAFAEGRQHGLEAGRAEGYMAGLQQGQKEVNETIAHLRQIATNFSTEVAQCSETMAPELLGLALDLAKAMLKTALKVQPELVLPTVSEAIQTLPVLQLPATVTLHPDDAALVREHMEQELAQHGWKIEEDPQISRGGCRIATRTNQIDATAETRWKRLAESLSRKLDWLD
ncbi:flagellar assembly protein FliH [Herbaspirillum sp. YR522]|uniref:flagellar assembly protein FliH n=1 Tax=Herbaspirillum sp. YR522 TaxID=1144342 RepID=UPI00026F64EC|nr:flagellar assembly protein FliH [Herbaspirillum sp. YR522]EJN08285.1 flagellar biosynthesis/type III secretory pathway protein [Herbaspirillum sp. YR522]